jgi:CheY-like chemotaxis protein
MLETHALEVDTAESAEMALEYLNDHRPDVIFMDHMMPGMDGFEAVTAIKNNPDTATIPIMMYTSQKGELYVGQARALGAVGVLPKEVEPVEVSKILASLRVIDSQEGLRGDDSRQKDNGEFPNLARLENLDQNLRLLILDLFEQQRSILRRDMLDSYETIASRVAEEIRPAADEEAPEEVANDGQVRRYQVAAVVLACLVLVFGWLYWEREQGWREVLQQNEELIDALAQQQSLEAESSAAAAQRFDRYQQTLGTAFETALEALAWRINQNGSYAYGEIPLGDKSIPQFESLLAQLLQLGFVGQVLIELHTGEFCLSRDSSDGYVPADDGLPVEQCDAIGFEPGYEIARQSVRFANFLNISQQQSGGQIRFDVVYVGNRRPLLAYPVAESSTPAREWNRIAAQNHRVSVTLNPDS